MPDVSKLITVLTSVFILLSAGNVFSSSKIQIGEPFPEFVLPSLEDGAPLSISSFRGEKIILHVFASW